MDDLGVDHPHVMECGAGPWLESDQLFDTIGHLTFVEPLEKLFERAKKIAGRGIQNGAGFTAHNVAIHPTEKEVTIVRPPFMMKQKGMRGGGSFLDCIKWKVGGHRVKKDKGKNWPRVQVKAAPFSSVDRGDINLLILDMEGSEWFALQDLISRPEAIMIEMQKQNPFRPEITEWFKRNGYVKSSHFNNGNFNQFFVKE